MPPAPVDERTIAGFFGPPTEQRASLRAAAGEVPLIEHADLEEHVLDQISGTTKRCDVTLVGHGRPLLSIELKRPEVVSSVLNSLLRRDALGKAEARGLPFYATCTVREIAVFDTESKLSQATPTLRFELVPGLTHSSQMRARRQELSPRWISFLDEFEALVKTRRSVVASQSQSLPPQVQFLREAIAHAAEECAARLALVLAGDRLRREEVIATFSEQFGVAVQLDPAFGPAVLREEAKQVALIATFVVATRLLLYQALATGKSSQPPRFQLSPLTLPNAPTMSPTAVAGTLQGLLRHARDVTGDFVIQLTPNLLDDLAFADHGGMTDVAERWNALVSVITRSDWTGPARYIPGLYESLLDDRHRHVLGVHYTPDAVTEVLVAYAIEAPDDRVMDPACGAGTFVTCAYERKRRLGSSHEQSSAEVYGVEIADFAAHLSALNLSLADAFTSAAYPRVIRSDFFHLRPGGPTSLTLPEGPVTAPALLDAIVGNPPYVRFESRTPAERLEIADLLAHSYLHEKLAYPNFTGKADLWAFFTARAASFLRDGGRLSFILSWSLLSSEYGDAVLAFLGRYFHIDAIVDSKVERFFAAKQNTVMIMCRRIPTPAEDWRQPINPNMNPNWPVRFVRLKRPLEALIDRAAPTGTRAEDMVSLLLGLTDDSTEDLRWDVRVVRQGDLLLRDTTLSAFDGQDLP